MGVLFQVELSFMPIQDILQWIDMNRLTCVVTISRENNSGVTFYLEKGKLVLAGSQKKGLQFGQFLVASGALSEVQVFQALTESKSKGVSLTRYLVENSLVSPGVLTDIMSDLVEKLILDLLANNAGSVSITTPLPEILANGPITLETARVLFNAVRIYDEQNRDSLQRDEAIEGINKRLYNEDFQLPVLPGMLMQLISLMEDDNTTVQEMVKLIMTDQVLISRILKVANSAFYSVSGQVDSIHYAIVRLGMREVLNIVTGIQVLSMQNRDIPQEKFQAILDGALKTAFLASGLARQLREDPEEAFLGGLLLDLGKTVILSVAKDFEIEESVFDELMHSRHAEIGAMIAKKWNYPESIQNLIRYHHNRNFGEIVNRMIALLQVADQAVQSPSGKEIDPKLLDSLDLPLEAVMEVHSKAMDSFNQIKSI
ncbi:HD domain protein [Citrifermentans bremense]|uniref:HD domain protein n=1 Tax=Citrifermentans bremense TaxID=60035 RepID=A0A6S6MB98_9BACT|nr:HDOD domain-containing protein [Citrifermentans bremense]BCG49116.1 HD domain protein [Citrifermentans bremense]